MGVAWVVWLGLEGGGTGSVGCDCNLVHRDLLVVGAAIACGLQSRLAKTRRDILRRTLIRGRSGVAPFHVVA